MGTTGNLGGASAALKPGEAYVAGARVAVWADGAEVEDADGRIAPCIGLVAVSDRDTALYAISGAGHALVAHSNTDAPGVHGSSQHGIGTQGYSSTSTGVYGSSGNPNAYAAWFDGKVGVAGTLEKHGANTFKIDHPLDPENQFLSHAAVESPDMKNVYDGVAVLDDQGEADVEMPNWFHALNSDFRYQLTCIGAAAPVYIAQEMTDGRFQIAGGSAGMKVCWQVTGVRQDPWAKANPIKIEQDKSDEERGYYLHPEPHGHPAEHSISRLRHPRVAEITSAVGGT